jgi:hypothetical protein
MFSEQQQELVNRIGQVLADLMPDDAVRIYANGQLAVSNAGVSFVWDTHSGERKHFPFDDQPFEEIIELSDAFIALRDSMVADGHDNWNGITFTLERDGRFDVNLEYGAPVAP